MSDVLGFAYFVFGGIVAGQTLYAMWMDDAFDTAPGEERVSFGGLAFLAIIFWLAWPVVWGAGRARKAYLKSKPSPTPEDKP